tara:strand:+ start:42 stop:761 length:720 start_codon:yes stop_codon:yes gene_type:complete
MSLPATAICISGVPKFWEKGLASIKKFFPDADVFMHIWDIEWEDLGDSLSGGRIGGYEEEGYDIYHIIKAFDPVSVSIEKFSLYGERWKKRLRWYQERGIISGGGHSISFMSARYGMSEAFGLKNNYAKQVAKKYDYSIRMRFDSDIKEFDVGLMDKEKVNIPAGEDHSPIGVNDQFAWGPDHLMKKFQTCYNSVDKIIRDTKIYAPEANFSEFLQRVKIQPELLHRPDNVTVDINSGS